MNGRIGIDGADIFLDINKLFRAHQIDFIQDDHIGKSDLIFDFRRIFELVF